MPRATPSSVAAGNAENPSPVFKAVNGSVQASVFQDGKRFNISISKRYRDSESQEWKSSKSLFPGDLANAIRALTRCLEYCETQL